MHVGLQWEPFLIKHVLTNFDRKKQQPIQMSFVCMRWTSSSRVAWLSACSTSTAVTSKPFFFNICPYQIKTTTLAWKQPFLCVPMEHAWREIMRPMFSQDFSSTICGFAGSGRLQQHSVSILNKSSRKQTQGKENNLQGNGFEWI